MTLFEKFETSEGRPITLNYNKYKIPKAGDIPEIKAIIVENADPTSPCGCKGIGEPALEIIAPAIANALHMATGKRYCNLPIAVKGEN